MLKLSCRRKRRRKCVDIINVDYLKWGENGKEKRWSIGEEILKNPCLQAGFYKDNMIGLVCKEEWYRS